MPRRAHHGAGDVTVLVEGTPVGPAYAGAATLTDVLVTVFREIFALSNTQSAVVQSAHHDAYLLLAIPAAFLNKRFSDRTGVLTGLGLAAGGGFLFYPAPWARTSACCSAR